jgi:hypothetical protein
MLTVTVMMIGFAGVSQAAALLPLVAWQQALSAAHSVFAGAPDDLLIPGHASG